jgi:hypothetical protein
MNLKGRKFGDFEFRNLGIKGNLLILYTNLLILESLDSSIDVC